MHWSGIEKICAGRVKRSNRHIRAVGPNHERRRRMRNGSLLSFPRKSLCMIAAEKSLFEPTPNLVRRRHFCRGN